MHKLYKLASTDERDKAIRFLLDRNYNFITRKFFYPKNTDCICIDFTNQLLSFRLFVKTFPKDGYDQLKSDVKKYEFALERKSKNVELELYKIIRKDYMDWNTESHRELINSVKSDRRFLESLDLKSSIDENLHSWFDHHDIQRLEVEHYKI